MIGFGFQSVLNALGEEKGEEFGVVVNRVESFLTDFPRRKASVFLHVCKRNPIPQISTQSLLTRTVEHLAVIAAAIHHEGTFRP